MRSRAVRNYNSNSSAVADDYVCVGKERTRERKRDREGGAARNRRKGEVRILECKVEDDGRKRIEVEE